MLKAFLLGPAADSLRRSKVQTDAQFAGVLPPNSYQRDLCGRACLILDDARAGRDAKGVGGGAGKGALCVRYCYQVVGDSYLFRWWCRPYD